MIQKKLKKEKMKILVGTQAKISVNQFEPLTNKQPDNLTIRKEQQY